MAEFLDIVDPTGRIVGVADRDTVHREGHWHQVFHCLVVRNGEPGRVVLQRRHADAAAFPGKLDISVGGHVASGEDPVAGGVREIREELGFDADPGDLIPLGRRLMVDDGGDDREGINREIAHVYLLADDRPLDDFDLDGCDVAGLVEITTGDLFTILADPDADADCSERSVDGSTFQTTCRAADLVPSIDGYWTVLAVMADRFATGHHPLAI